MAEDTEHAIVEHATAVATEDASGTTRGVLILGPSGAGKSGLALRMLALGARLVADDRVELYREAGRLIARAPAPLAGLIEARGVGILRLPARRLAPSAAVVLAVDLARAPGARMPQRCKIALLGLEIDLIPGHGVPNLDSILVVLSQNGAETL